MSRFHTQINVRQVIIDLPEPLRRAKIAERLAEGFSHHVLLLDQQWIVRINKHEGVRSGQHRESELCRQVSAKTETSVPYPIELLAPGEGMPFGGSHYPVIHGTSPSDVRPYLPALGGFLQALHAIDQPDLPECRMIEIARLAELLAEVGISLVDEWCESLSELQPATMVTVHGDFWPGNILVENDQLAAVIDFENASLGDPAIDFAGMLYLGEDIVHELLGEYRKRGGHDIPIAAVRCWALQREAEGLEYALRHPESGELQDAISKVKLALSRR